MLTYRTISWTLISKRKLLTMSETTRSQANKFLDMREFGNISAKMLFWGYFQWICLRHVFRQCSVTGANECFQK